MKSNRKTLDLDSVLIRQLNIKNFDNTPPPANYSILTDGKGGTYLSSIFNTATPTGFNEVYLPDINESNVADLSYNVLGLKAGVGTTLFFDSEKNVVINTLQVLRSTFSFISTPTGKISANKSGAGFNISTNYGVNLITDSDNNLLIFSGNPSYNTINISTLNTFTQLKASSTQSTITLTSGFGINLNVNPTSQSIEIATSQNGYSLNEIKLDNLSTFNFGNTYNNLEMSSKGNISLTQKNTNTLQFETHGFSRIVTDTNQILEASTSGEALKLLRGRGIDYQVTNNSLTIMLASTGTVIKTETVSTTANSNNILNLRAGSSITYSNTDDGSLLIDTTDFNRITCTGNNTTISSSTVGTSRKSLTLAGGNGLSVNGNPTTNTVTIEFVNDDGNEEKFSFSNVNVYSNLGNSGPINTYPAPSTITAFPNTSATLSIGGITPIFLETSPAEKIMYIRLNSDLLLSTVSSNIGVLHNTILSYNTNFNTSSLNASTISILNNQVLTNTTTFGSNLDVNNIIVSTVAISPTSTLMSFNFSTMCVGINKPQASLINGVSLDVKGTILAHKYATYSDPILKDFIKPYKFSLSQIDSFQPSHFRWLSNNEDDIGFSATDVEKILPTAVTAPNGIKMVDYSKISIISIAALKDANMRIKALESTVQALQAKLL